MRQTDVRGATGVTGDMVRSRKGRAEAPSQVGLKLGYNTNGFAHHGLEDVIGILADLGYHSVALTLDYHALDPYDPGTPAQVERVRELLSRHQMSCVIETGARFLLDPRRKHHP